MNTAEGPRRAAAAIRWVALIWLLGVSLSIFTASEAGFTAELLFVALAGGVPAIGALVIAWIVHGIAKSKDSTRG